MEKNVSYWEEKRLNLGYGLRQIKNDIRSDPISWSVIFFISLFFITFLVVPLILILYSAINYNGTIKFDAIVQIFSDKQFFDPIIGGGDYFIQIYTPPGGGVSTIFVTGLDFGIVLNTLIIGIFTTLLSVGIGLTTAFLMARVNFQGKTVLNGLLLIPLVLPPFVSGIGFFAMFGNEGIINKFFLGPVLGINVIFQGLFAIIFVQSMHYFTLIHLNVYSALMNADPSMEEQAENLGAKRSTITRKITLPLATPGIASGSILVFILSMEDLGTPIIFGGFGDAIAKKTMTYYIKNNFFAGDATTEIGKTSAAIGALLLVIAILGFIFIRKYVSLRQYSMVSKGRAGTYRSFNPNVFQKVGVYLFFAGLLITATLPHIGILFRSVTKAGTTDQFTSSFYQLIFESNQSQGFLLYVQNTLIYSFTATIFIMVLATMAGYVANRKKFFGMSFFDTLVTIPIAIPGVVLGIGYIRMFGNFPDWGIFTLNPLFFPPTILIISYTVRKFPFTVRSVYSGLQQTDEVLEEAALNLGASKPRVLARIIIPLIILNIVGGALVSLVYIMSEVSTTLILISDSRYGNLVWKLADISAGKLGVFAAVGVLLMMIQAVSLMVTNLLLRNRAEALTGI